MGRSRATRPSGQGSGADVNRRFFPSQDDLADPIKAERIMRMVFDQLYQIQGKIGGEGNTSGSGVTGVTSPPVAGSGAGSGSGSGSGPAPGPTPTPSSSGSGLTLAQISAALRSSGPVPLNVEGLLGRLAMPQRAYLASALVLPDPQVSQDGEIYCKNNILYRFAGGSPGAWVPVIAAGTILYDTYANIPAASSKPDGTVFFATDRTVTYVNENGTWWYLAGIMKDTLANKPSLGASDIGFLFHATDYNHLFLWSGSAWGWGPGENGSGYIMSFAIAPTGNGWHICDGTAITYVKADTTTASVTPPDLRGGVFPRFSSAFSTSVVSASQVTVPVSAANVTGASNFTPIVITTSTNHGLVDGTLVAIDSVGGNTAANGLFYADVLTNTAFALYADQALTSPVAGSGAYTSGGGVTRLLNQNVPYSDVIPYFRK